MSEWINRADVALDILCPDMLDLGVMRARRIPASCWSDLMGNDREGESLYLGKRTAPVSAVIHRKGVYILHSGTNAFFRGIWGVPEKDVRRVHRLELRFSRRFFLKDCPALDSVAGVRDSVGMLGAIGIQRYRIAQTTEGRADRRELDPFWAVATGHYKRSWKDRGVPDRAAVTRAEKREWSAVDVLSRRVLPALKRFAGVAGIEPGASVYEHLQAIQTLIAEDSAARAACEGAGLACELPF